MSPAPLRIGPFELEDLAGQGAMGLVWRARHIGLELPVAIKILRKEVAQEPGFRKAFELEIESVARLRHPGVVTLLDTGEIDAQTAEQSGGRLSPSVPWVAMELATLGTMADANHPKSWLDLRSRLIALLDALAHAHARGVIHRDLKPTNVLLTHDTHGRVVPRLTDFGIAHALFKPQSNAQFASAGTPAYMAPEQIRGDVRDIGPWTDLYALGCLAWWLATRVPPYHADTREGLLRQHLSGDLPKLQPAFSIPPGFSTWLQGLLDKRRHGRFQRAADARAMLDTLDGRALGPATPWISERAKTIERENTLMSSTASAVVAVDVTMIDTQPVDSALDSTQHATPAANDRVLLDSVDEAAATLQIAPHGRTDAPERWQATTLLRNSWRDHEPNWDKTATPGAGLGLYGLRSLPVIGRGSERDVLWRAWRASIEDSSTRVVVVRGQAGVGKSCLAEWLTERTHELGADVLRAQFEHVGVRALEEMAARHLRCDGLERRPLEARLLQVCSERQWGQGDSSENIAFSLADFIAVEGVEQGPESGSSRRYDTLQMLLEQIGRQRPMCIWLDDAHVGADGLRFTMHLLERMLGVSCLILVTARDDVLLSRPAEAALLEQLRESPNCDDIVAGAMSAQEHEHLIRVSLGLDESLVAEVARRTAGNPLFAVQLVGDLVQRGVLEPRQQGYVLREGEHADLPDDLHSLWRERLSTALPEPHDQIALELAAALGGEIDPAEWDMVCRTAGVKRDVSVKELVARQIAVRRQRLWSFVHGMLRESVERIAREGDRWADHHRACAAILSRTDYGQPGIADKLGRHLLESRQFDRAYKVLKRAADEALQTASHDQAMELMDLQEKTLHARNTPPNDPAWGDLLLNRARVNLRLDELDEAERNVRATETLAAEHGLSSLEPWIAAVSGHLSQRRGQLRDAYAQLTYAIERLQHHADRNRLCYSRLLLAIVLTQMGDLRAAQHHARVAEVDCRKQSLRHYQSLAYQILGGIHRRLGEYDEAEQHLSRAQAMFEDQRDTANVAQCKIGLAEVARAKGELDQAEVWYREVLGVSASLPHQTATTAMANLGLTLTQRADYMAAHAFLLAARARYQQQERYPLSGAMDISMLPCAAGLGDWQAWDARFSRGYALLHEYGVVDPDIAQMALLAGDLAHQAGETRRTIEAWELAAHQFGRLGDRPQALAIQRKLAELVETQDKPTP